MVFTLLVSRSMVPSSAGPCSHTGKCVLIHERIKVFVNLSDGTPHVLVVTGIGPEILDYNMGQLPDTCFPSNGSRSDCPMA